MALLIVCPQTAPASSEEKVHAYEDVLLMLKQLNPCPVCGAETALAEIEPHPLHVDFEIHGYLCGRCGPIKSLVVLRSWSPRPLH
jgi:ribosomal protein S27AE